MSTQGKLSYQGSQIKRKIFKPKRPKSKLFRASEPFLSVFMWGINHTINGLSHVTIPVMLMPDDFKANSKVRVDNMYFNKDNLPSHYVVKDYCPLVFRNLREKFGISDNQYLSSLTKFQPVSLDVHGRSGAKFYQSYDKLFVIKTLLKEEVAQMHTLLKKYHPYIVECYGQTLLPQYLGMYRITVEGTITYAVVMRNIFATTLTIHKKYDLKGSTVDRDATDKEREMVPPTLKDNDFTKEGIKVYIGQEAKDKLMVTLKSDITFLSEQNVMDYSLCLGIHYCNQQEEAMESEQLSGSSEEEEEENITGEWPAPTPPDSPSPSSTALPDTIQAANTYSISSSSTAPRKEVYFVGLVDILTHFGMWKRTAQAAKTMKHGSGAEISTVPPELYARRFTEFIDRVFE